MVFRACPAGRVALRRLLRAGAGEGHWHLMKALPGICARCCRDFRTRSGRAWCTGRSRGRGSTRCVCRRGRMNWRWGLPIGGGPVKVSAFRRCLLSLSAQPLPHPRGACGQSASMRQWRLGNCGGCTGPKTPARMPSFGGGSRGRRPLLLVYLMVHISPEGWRGVLLKRGSLQRSCLRGVSKWSFALPVRWCGRCRARRQAERGRVAGGAK